MYLMCVVFSNLSEELVDILLIRLKSTNYFNDNNVMTSTLENDTQHKYSNTNSANNQLLNIK